MKDDALGVFRVRSLHEEVGFRIADQLQPFMGERDRPVFAELGGEIREDEPVRDATVVLIVIAECIFHVGLVPHVNDGVAAHVGEILFAGTFLTPTFQAQSGAQAPIWFKILADLPVDRADGCLEFFVTDLAVCVVNH